MGDIPLPNTVVRNNDTSRHVANMGFHVVLTVVSRPLVLLGTPCIDLPSGVDGTRPSFTGSDLYTSSNPVELNGYVVMYYFTQTSIFVNAVCPKLRLLFLSTISDLK